MLFNGSEFIFFFLPLVLAGYFLLGAFCPPIVVAAATAVASLVFYAWEEPFRLLSLILISIAFNFTVGRELVRRPRRWLMWLGVGGNLAYLFYFKYAGFFVDNLIALGVPLETVKIALPIGISFYSFTQIAFLVDAYRGEVKECRPAYYALFVTYFPHLVAGPILHHKEMIPQFTRPSTYRFDLDRFTRGLSWFAAGMFKKVMLADSLSVSANQVYGALEGGALVTKGQAWLGTLNYALQLYFDFSGYSDMAIGLALCMGIVFPLNFFSPYKATSLTEFWRRWHITLSQFLRDYLYIPLGGNRRGHFRRHLNLLTTMLLGGLWHGASWNFVLWGALHGMGLVINNLWRERLGFKSPRWFGLLVTQLFVVLAWIPFRAANLAATRGMWRSLWGRHGAATPVPLVGDVWILTLLALLIAWCLPNTAEIFDEHRKFESETRLRWEPTLKWALVLGIAFGISIGRSLIQPSAFLYFRF